MNREDNALVIVPCGRRKIWDKYPRIGAVQAKDAYTSPYFKLCKQYARRFSNKWIILSAKYGFIKPEFVIPKSYNVTFNNRDKKCISDAKLEKQINKLGVRKFTRIVVLGGKVYYHKVRKVWKNSNVDICNPLSGLQIGRRQRKLRDSIQRNKRLL